MHDSTTITLRRSLPVAPERVRCPISVVRGDGGTSTLRRCRRLPARQPETTEPP